MRTMTIAIKLINVQNGTWYCESRLTWDSPLKMTVLDFVWVWHSEGLRVKVLMYIEVESGLIILPFSTVQWGCRCLWAHHLSLHLPSDPPPLLWVQSRGEGVATEVALWRWQYRVSGIWMLVSILMYTVHILIAHCGCGCDNNIYTHVVYIASSYYY